MTATGAWLGLRSSVLAAAGMIGIAATGLVFASGTGLDARTASQRDPLFPLPSPPKLDKAKAELGKALFYDPILSKKQMMSCSTCHDLKTGGTVPLKRTVGYDGRMHEFNAPTVFNAGNNYRLGWRGKFTSLIDQNESVILDRNLMANDWKTLLPRLAANDFYRAGFEASYGEPPSRENVLDSLAIFQRSLATPDAPFDRFLEGDGNAISQEQKHGYELFKSYGCVSCHQGSNIGGNMFQIFGVFAPPDTATEPGVSPGTTPWPLTAFGEDREVFRVPSLRNVEVTAPYFHDGRAESLTEAVAIMGRSQLGRQLGKEDIAAITEFLKSLTGEYNGERLKSRPVEGDR